jgi:CelD/BcsL family acetyltransferase involved in cellulose biosynthesis
MVDALATTEPADDGVEIAVEAADPRTLRRYRDFAGPRVKGAAQHPLWFETWLRETGDTGHIVWLKRGGRAIAALPLVETRINGLPALAFAGGAHANGNFCPTSEPDAAMSAAMLADAVRRALPHIALISLERQHRSLGGQANILLDLSTRTSPNLALAASLEGGFAGLLERSNGKKRAKKRRAQTRRFDEAGGSALAKPSSADEIGEVLGTFFRLKSARFEKAGIADAFGPPHIRSFWRALLEASQAEPDRPFTIEALVVGGSVRAITGSSHLLDRTVCEFGAIEDDELKSISPGEYLAYSNLEEACAKGLPCYDFSVGDEAYKRTWCDLEIRHFDAVIPLSAAARLAVIGSNLAARAKQTIKSNPQLWSMAKAMRRLR